MKALFTSLFLLMGSIASASVSPIDSCEFSASPRARVLARLIGIGLQEQYFSVEEIAEFVANPEFYNPYFRYSKSETTLALRNGFERASVGVTPYEIVDFKKSLVTLVLLKGAHKQDVALAQKETEQILAPKVMRQLKVPGYMNRSSPLDLTWRNGRPIFLARMDETRRGSNRTMAVILDPFNSRVANRVTGVPRTSGTGNPKGNFEFFERNGIPYAVDFAQNFFIDLNKMENTAHSIFRNSYQVHIESSALCALVKGPDFVRIISMNGAGKYENQIIASDLLSPREEPRVLRGNVARMRRPPKVFYADDRTYVAYPSNTAIHIYDAGADTMLEPIKSELGDYSENKIEIYSDGGEHYLAIAEDAPRFKMRLRIINLRTRKSTNIPGRFTHPQDFGFALSDGSPHLHFFDSGELCLLDVRTRKAECIPSEITSAASRFNWSGREFLMWAANGNLHIFDFGSRTILDFSNALPENTYQMVPFHFRGQVYAMIAVSDELPYLLRLTAGGVGK